MEDVKKRNYKLDITWLKDDSIEDADSLPEPQELITEAVNELQIVVNELNEMLLILEAEK